jgi:hypothetical protein
MERPLSIYEVECLTEEGLPIEGEKHLALLDPSIEREVQFMEISHKVSGNPHNYDVRALRPEEITKRMKEERRQQRVEAGRRITREAMSQVVSDEDIFGLLKVQGSAGLGQDIR